MRFVFVLAATSLTHIYGRNEPFVPRDSCISRHLAHGPSLEINPADLLANAVKDFDRKEVSRGRDGKKTALPIGGESQTGLDIFSPEIGKIGENALNGHSRSQIVKHVIDRNP